MLQCNIDEAGGLSEGRRPRGSVPTASVVPSSGKAVPPRAHPALTVRRAGSGTARRSAMGGDEIGLVRRGDEFQRGCRRIREGAMPTNRGRDPVVLQANPHTKVQR